MPREYKWYNLGLPSARYSIGGFEPRRRRVAFVVQVNSVDSKVLCGRKGLTFRKIADFVVKLEKSKIANSNLFHGSLYLFYYLAREKAYQALIRIAKKAKHSSNT